jgi:hypothetical protein
VPRTPHPHPPRRCKQARPDAGTYLEFGVGRGGGSGREWGGVEAAVRRHIYGVQVARGEEVLERVEAVHHAPRHLYTRTARRALGARTRHAALATGLDF